jgi:hypothetical protein
MRILLKRLDGFIRVLLRLGILTVRHGPIQKFQVHLFNNGTIIPENEGVFGLFELSFPLAVHAAQDQRCTTEDENG